MSSKEISATAVGARSSLAPKRRFPEFQEAEAWAPVSLRRASVPVDERVGERKLTPVSISAGIGFVPQMKSSGAISLAISIGFIRWFATVTLSSIKAIR